MCGIVGIVSAWASGFTSKEADIFADMLFVDTLRGWDSTGVFGGDWHGNVLIHKEASAAPEFLRKPELKEFRYNLTAKGAFAVGHNRAATRGSVNDQNAHPFWVDDKIVLVHNGSFFGSHKHLKDVEVDSEAIAHIISENDDIQTALKKVDSAYALVWYNANMKQLNLIRNDYRPLYLGFLHSGAMLFASEPTTIRHAVARADVKFKEEPYLLEAGTLVTISFNSEKSKWSIDEKTIDITPEKTKDFFGGGRRHVFDSLEDYYGMYRAGGLHQNDDDTPVMMRQPQPPHLQLPYASKDVRRTLREILAETRPDVGVTHKDAMIAMESFREMQREQKTFIIELEDYEPCNTHPQCRMWHVWGRMVEAEPTPANKIVFHWFVEDKNANEILEYVTRDHAFYEVTPSTVVGERVTEDQMIVSVFAKEHVEYLSQ